LFDILSSELFTLQFILFTGCINFGLFYSSKCFSFSFPKD